MEFIEFFLQALVKNFFETNLVLLTVVGWFSVYALTLKSNKVQLKNEASLEIFKELQQLKAEFDKSSIDLGVLLSEFTLPFRDMEWVEKGIGENKDKNPFDLWQQRNKELIDSVSLFNERSQGFLNTANVWVSVTPNLKKARNILSAETSVLSTELWAYISFCTNPQDLNFNWKEWDREKVKNKTLEIREKFDRVAVGFFYDYMDLIYDELLKPIFYHKRKRRENFNYVEPRESETLTKNGIKKIKYSAMEGAKIHKEKRDKK